jgi:exonuclease III
MMDKPKKYTNFKQKYEDYKNNIIIAGDFNGNPINFKIDNETMINPTVDKTCCDSKLSGLKANMNSSSYDNILVKQNSNIIIKEKTEVHEVAKASDHLPITATISIKPIQSGGMMNNKIEELNRLFKIDKIKATKYYHKHKKDIYPILFYNKLNEIRNQKNI